MNPTTDRSPLAAQAWVEATANQALAMNFVAEVLAQRDDGGFELAAPEPCLATPAVSCLVVPQPGDRVACWRVAAGEAETVYILAVLERRSPQPTRLCLAPGAELTVHDGAAELSATKSLRLLSPELSAQADTARLDAGDATLVARALSTIGEVVSATVGQLRLVGALFSTSFDHQVHHAGQHRRTVDGVDRVDAQVIQQQAGTLLQLQGENLLANGERVVKMRGAQIHLG